MSSEVMNELIKRLNEFKVYQEHTFDEKLNELLTFIREGKINELMLIEVLSGFIIDRCDNMLANTSDRKRTRIINELAMEALKLYIYSKLKQELFKDKEFVRWFTSFKNISSDLEIKAKSLEELIEQLRKLGIIKVSLEENVEELIKNPIIKSKNELNKHLEAIQKLLDKQRIAVLVFPLDDYLPLFFKMYYVASNDPGKVKKTATSIAHLISRIMDIDELIENDDIRSRLDKIKSELRKIIGGEDILDYSKFRFQEGAELEKIPSLYIREAKDLDKVIRKDNQMKAMLDKLLHGEEQIILAGYHLLKLSKIRDNTRNRTYIAVKFREKELARIKVGKIKKTISKLRNALMSIMEQLNTTLM